MVTFTSDGPNGSSWIHSLLRFVNEGGQTQTYTDLGGGNVLWHLNDRVTDEDGNDVWFTAVTLTVTNGVISNGQLVSGDVFAIQSELNDARVESPTALFTVGSVRDFADSPDPRGFLPSIFDGNDRIDAVAASQNVWMEGYGGGDWIRTGLGNDLISGGNGRDTLIGLGGADRINGDQDGDFIYGGDGNDRLNGGVGVAGDILSGGAGDDLLIGWDGKDTMTGGAGADTFRFSAAVQSRIGYADIITDFDDGNTNDRIDLSALIGLTKLRYIHDASFTGNGQIRIHDIAGPDVMVEVNIGGTLAPDMHIRLVGTKLASMSADDFIL